MAPVYKMTEQLAYMLCNAIYNVENLNMVDHDQIHVNTLHALLAHEDQNMSMEEIVRTILEADDIFVSENEVPFLRRRVRTVLYTPHLYDPML